MSEIIIENLSKTIKNNKILDNVNLTFESGHVYGLVGRNGSGKTMLLRAICGLIFPDSGKVIIDGKQLHKDISFPESCGIIIENTDLLPNFSAFDNLKMLSEIKNTANDNMIKSAIKSVGLDPDSKKKVKTFSLGMKQRLGIGLALVGEPDLLVLDEPINGLDPQGIAEIRDTILRLKNERSMTICISSHILEELSKIATDYGIIHNGSLLQELTRDELMKRCGERMELTLDNPREAIPVLDAMGFANYQVVDKERIHIFERLNESALVNMELAKAGIPVKGISITSEELETYFLNLTGGAAHA